MDFEKIYTSQAFAILLTFGFYILGIYLYKKTKSPLFNPLIVASILLMGYIKVLGLNLKDFLNNINGISLFLGPMIVALAIPIFKQFSLIKKNILPILVGTVIGSITSIVTVIIFGRMFGLTKEVIASIIPKSSTAAIAIEVSSSLGGVPHITIAVTSITAVSGAVILPMLVKLFRIKDPVLVGLGLGTTSHALGTSKALEIDPIAGAISGIALVFAGVITVIISLFL